jgi:glutamate-5-semialdehyde dehydrogenase
VTSESKAPSIRTEQNNSVIEQARRAKASARVLARLTGEEKNRGLQAIADSIAQSRELILAENEKDLDAAWKLVENGQLAESLYRRLKLDDSKLNDIVAGIRQVASMKDPIGQVLDATELDDGLELYKISCPIGVVGVIFESRPDALTQISSLCLKSSNAVLLKGGREAEHSNRVLFNLIQTAAVNNGIPADAIGLLESREDVNSLLKAEGFVDLIIPRGSNDLVRFIQQNTNIPVLGHADGLCHIYVDGDADIAMATEIICDAKINYPAVCNAVETVLIHSSVVGEILPELLDRLVAAGVEVRCEPALRQEAGLRDTTIATEEDWSTEYCDLILSIKAVDSVEEAIEHINKYGSRHTDAVVTKDDRVWQQFAAEVDSAGVFRNASTRFADGYRYGFGAEVGISTGKLHPRGPVGLEGLITYKYQLIGNGQTVGMYSGPSRRQFTHRKIDRR